MTASTILETPAGTTSRRPGRRLPIRAAIRLGSTVLVLWAVATLVFLAQHLMPGDPGRIILGGSPTTAAQIGAVDHEYGFDRPLLLQYGSYLGQLVRGDLGSSWSTQQPVAEMIGQQAGATVLLTLAALATAWVLAVCSALATAGRGRVLSALGSGLEVITAALPQYWLGTILLVGFAIENTWFPVAGGSGLRALALPALALGIPLAGFLAQLGRDEFDTALDQPFVTSARARGMGDPAVRLRHVLRHAVLPGVTLTGWALGALISGAVVVEAVFTRQGIGEVLVTAVVGRDMPVVAGVTLLIAAVYAVAGLLVDALHQLLDPRLRRPS